MKELFTMRKGARYLVGKSHKEIKTQEKEAREGRGGTDRIMGRRTKEGDEKKMNERMKTRETMAASGNTKKRRKRLLAASAEEHDAGGGWERVEKDRKRKRTIASKPRSH